MIIEETEFRKKPILVMKDEETKRIMFSAGLNKCKVILTHLKDIQIFIDKYNIISNKI